MKNTQLMTALLLLGTSIAQAQAQAQATVDLEALVKNQIDSQSETALDEAEKKLPWTRGIKDEGARSHIYIPDNYDYHLIQELMSGSGFGPGNGGNRYIFEVDSMIKKIIATINSNKEVFPEIDLEKFTKEVQTIGVFFLNTLPNDTDRVLAAANFTDKKAILIHKPKWEEMTYKERVVLLLHEYLGVMEIEKENAVISSRISGLILTQKALQSFDPTSLKWLYSRSNTEVNIQKLNFSNNKTGVYTNRFGEDAFTWRVNNNTTYIKLSGKKTYKSSSYANHPVTDQHMYVDTEVTALDLEVRKLDTGFFEIKETAKSCKTFPSYESGVEDLKVCEFTNKSFDELIGASKLPVKSIDLRVGDSIALPVPSLDQFNSIHLVEVLQAGKVKHLEGYGDFRINELNTQDNNIQYTTTDGKSFSLQVIKKQNGLNRAVLTVEIDGENHVTIEPMAIIKGNVRPQFERTDAIGEFLPIYAGAGHTGENWEPYIFDSEGFGGFQTSFDGVEFQDNLWSWSLKGDRINAKRYLLTDGYNYTGRPENREEIEMCLRTPVNCIEQQDRDYIILKKNGNRYTMLRLFRVYSPNFDVPGLPSTTLQNENSSLWVMDKL